MKVELSEKELIIITRALRAKEEILSYNIQFERDKAPWVSYNVKELVESKKLSYRLNSAGKSICTCNHCKEKTNEI